MKPPLRPLAAEPTSCGVDQHDVARRVALLGDDRRPQPGVAAADDAQVARSRCARASGWSRARRRRRTSTGTGRRRRWRRGGAGRSSSSTDGHRSRPSRPLPTGEGGRQPCAVTARHGPGIAGRRAAVAAASGGLGLASAQGAGRRGRRRWRSAGATRRGSTQAAADGRPRRASPLVVRRRRRRRAARVRRRGDRGARRRRHPRHQRRRAAARQLRRRRRRRLSGGAIDLNLMSVVGDVQGGRAGDAGAAAGGGSWRSRRWRCASRCRNLILSNTARAGATGVPQDARPRGRRRRGHGQLACSPGCTGPTGSRSSTATAPDDVPHGRRRRLRRHRRLPVQRAGEVPHRRPDPRRRRRLPGPAVTRLGDSVGCSRTEVASDGGQELAASRARRVRTLARWVRYSTLALRSACGSASAAACSAASATDAPPASADGDARGEDRRRAHVDEADAGVAVAPPGGDADDRPVLGPPVELLEAPAGAVHLRARGSR